MIHQSKVDFSFSQSKNYNPEIIQFLNFIIELPSQASLGDSFNADMEDFFKKVEDEAEVQRMASFDKQKPQQYTEKHKLNKDMFKRKEPSSASHA